MGMRGYNPSNNGEPYFDEGVYRQRVAALLGAKDRAAFVSTGYIFVDPAQIVLFFRSKVRPAVLLSQKENLTDSLTEWRGTVH